jgi:integrase
VTLTFEQFSRLLRAAQGWSYDLDTGKWAEDYEPDLEVVGKYSLLYFYHGGRDKTLLPLRWGIGFEGGCIDAANGRIYRRPPGAESTDKRAEPANLLGDLRGKVKEWERQDFKNGWIHVLHDASGGEITSMRSRFDRVKKKAGLEWMHPHDLKHTGVSLLSHAGLDISVIADAMSTRADTLRQEYEHLNFLWIAPRTTGSVRCNVSMKRLAKTSPPDSHGWTLRAARWKKNQELQREKKKAKRREKAAAVRRNNESQNAAA